MVPQLEREPLPSDVHVNSTPTLPPSFQQTSTPLPPTPSGGHLAGEGFDLSTLVPSAENAENLRNKILAVLRSLRPSRSLDLDDLTQDIWLNAWINHTPITIQHIRHRLINRLRSTAIYNHKLEEAKVVYATDSTDRALVREKINQVIRHAQLLPGEQQLLFCVFHLDLPYSKIAERLHWTESRVESTLHAVLSKLQRSGRVISSEGDR